MFISRNVYDPKFSQFPGNRLKRTTGFYGHLPKFWDCKTYDFDSGWKKFSRFDNPNDDQRPQWHIDLAKEQRARHANCKRKHVSYVGYLRYVGRKHTYTFWYMGNPYHNKIFERFTSLGWS